MQKLHLHIEAASKMAFMDSTGTLDHEGSRVFVLLIHSECGGLSLGIIVTSSESCDVLEIGFQIIKEILVDDIFGGNIYGPSIFLTDDSQLEQNAIRTGFPTNKIFERIKAFNVVQLIDFLPTKLNLYFQRRLLDAVNRASHRSFSKSISPLT